MGWVACRSIENLRRSLVLALLIAVGVQTSWAEDESENTALKFTPEAAATFNKRCTACHTYGKGIKVGPDLKGVTERRKRDWLVKFIHASSVVIKSGDPHGNGLIRAVQTAAHAGLDRPFRKADQ